MSVAATERRVRRVRVLLADDAEDFRFLLRRRLERDGRFVVVGEAANGEEAVELAVENEPDVAVVDLAMPVMNGIDAMREIRQKAPGVKIVVLTAFDPDELAGEVLDEGAYAYIRKGTATSQLLTVLAPLAPPEFE